MCVRVRGFLICRQQYLVSHANGLCMCSRTDTATLAKKFKVMSPHANIWRKRFHFYLEATRALKNCWKGAATLERPCQLNRRARTVLKTLFPCFCIESYSRFFAVSLSPADGGTDS
jgi:hypothetical protein